jgi:adenylate kinase family enzyme
LNCYPHLTYVIVPLLIPGSGKSTLAQAITECDSSVRVIDSDKLRSAILKQSEHSESMIENYTKTKAEALQQYREVVKEAIGNQPPK